MFNKDKYDTLVSLLLSKIKDNYRLRYGVKLKMPAIFAEIYHHTGLTSDIYYKIHKMVKPPNPIIVEALARLGVKEGLDRTWVEKLLDATDFFGEHSDYARKELLDDLFPLPASRKIIHNLPTMTRETFVGRSEIMDRLFSKLGRLVGVHMIVIAGIGGSGKTELALQVAWTVYYSNTGEKPKAHVPEFHYIIFISAKLENLLVSGIKRVIHTPPDNLNDICIKILSVTGHPTEHANISANDEPRVLVKEKFRQIAEDDKERALLIIDNMETIVDRLVLIDFLEDIHREVKVIITTRGWDETSPTHLKELNQEDGLSLIYMEAREKEVTLGDSESLQLYKRSGGIPAAIIYSIGLLSASYTYNYAINAIGNPTGDVAQFIFKNIMDELRNNYYSTYEILLAAAIFSCPANVVALAATAGYTYGQESFQKGIAKLKQLSLLNLDKNNRYSMLSLTKEFVLTELENNPEFKESAYKRFIQWYSELATKNRVIVGKDEPADYQSLDQEWCNFLEVFYLCIYTDNFDLLCKFWFEDRLELFAIIYCYWDDLLIWMERVAELAKQRDNWETVVKALYTSGYIRAWRVQANNNLKEIQEKITSSLNYVTKPNEKLKTETYRYQAFIASRQKEFSEADAYIKNAQNALNTFRVTETANQEEFEVQQIYLNQTIAEIHYARGDFVEAEKIFQTVKGKAERLKMQRNVFAAISFLCDIDLGKLEPSQELLTDIENRINRGIEVTQSNNDLLRKAFFLRTQGKLHEQRKSLKEANASKKASLDIFQYLGIIQQATGLI